MWSILLQLVEAAFSSPTAETTDGSVLLTVRQKRWCLGFCWLICFNCRVQMLSCSWLDKRQEENRLQTTNKMNKCRDA